jgi:hypothetical protein
MFWVNLTTTDKLRARYWNFDCILFDEGLQSPEGVKGSV